MITYAEFEVINEEVKNAVNECFNFLKNKTTNYILFLANGEFKKDYINSHLKLNPYIIDSREDRYKDKDRRIFYVEFLKLFYSFPSQQPTDDNISRMHMELMVYSHIWESKPFLKQLWRLALSVDSKPYPWQLIVPDMSKHEVIRFEIRNRLLKRNLTLATVISNGFHTSLRNAFAHSEYYFNEFKNEIVLDTYTGKSWDIATISYNDWSKKFVYSLLLTYHFQNTVYERRESLINDFNTNRFIFTHPINQNTFRARYLIYDPHFDTFNFESNLH